MTERVQTTSGEPARGLLLTDKHIVFAVMAASAVAVIVFLCGVFVGRGVLSAQPAGDGVGQDGRLIASEGPGLAGEGVDDAGGGGEETGTGVTSPPSQGIDYPERLTGKAMRDEGLRPQEQTLALPGPPPEAPPESPSPTLPARTGSSAASAPAPLPPAKVKEDPGKGPYTVQVASFRQKQRADAQRIVDNLNRHGFPAYLFAPASGSNEGFRVRVGTYKSRQEADVMAARLQKEKYKTWITRLPS